MNRFFMMFAGVLFGCVLSVGISNAQEDAGTLPHTMAGGRAIIEFKGVGGGEAMTSGGGNPLPSGTLSYNEDCNCQQCSGAAKDCHGTVVTSGGDGYNSNLKRGTYSSNGDTWSCMPPAANCYVVIKHDVH